MLGNKKAFQFYLEGFIDIIKLKRFVSQICRWPAAAYTQLLILHPFFL
jgi:hypothetical protein